MIHVDWAADSAAARDAAAALVASLRALGHRAGLPGTSLPSGMPHNQAAMLAHLVAPAPPGPGDRLLVLGAEAVTDRRLADLRQLAGRGLQRVLLAGTFASRQVEIGVTAKFGHVLDQDPRLLPLLPEERSLLSSPLGPVFGVDRGANAGSTGPLRVLLVAPEDAVLGPRALQTLAAARRLQVTVLTDGESKTALRQAGATLPLYHYTEAPPGALAATTDVAVFCRPVPRAHPIRMLLADLAVGGAALLDAAPGFANRARDPAFVPAPAEAAALLAFLLGDVAPGLGELRQIARASALARQSATALAALCDGLDAPAPGVAQAPRRRQAPPPRREAGGQVLFLPTNGVGLGHAQRCTLIAGDLARRPGTRPVFAAFPSCLRLIKTKGFDAMALVQKTAAHADASANDLVNSQRLDHLVPGCAVLVFDGGHVFTSVFRSLLNHRVPGVWVRRGLWQPGQDNAVALDREKAFQRVIVPLEAFDELNSDLSHGPQVTRVGPIVQDSALAPPDRARLRQGLTERFSLPFQHLVVTMLGGGVAADRSAQTVALAAGLARRRDVLHLVVVWPTATVEPALFAWPNTRVVRTHHAGVLAAACDLSVSAVGYNSFHEALYARIPTIFVPQMAAYMDDQRARARAAADRGAALLVEPQDLASLDRQVGRMLDQGEGEGLRQRLAGLDLPAPGTAAAAAAIADLAGIGPARPMSLPERRSA